MRRSYLFLLLAIGSIWGASFMFIKVAGRDFAPTTMMLGRVLLASAGLLTFLAWQRGLRDALSRLREAGRGAYVIGVVQAAVPFTLIAWGEHHVDSGIAAIANATMPIFVALLAIPFMPRERVGGGRMLGILIGLIGVAVVVGIHPGGGWLGVAGTLACVLAALCYATGTLWGQHLVAGLPGPVLALTGMLGASTVLLVPGIAQAPHDLPAWKPVLSVLALGLGGTALAQILFYRLLVGFGSARTSLVIYLLPPFALFYGVTLLDEPLRAAAVAGLVLILAGVAIASGAVRLPRREPVGETP